jgi:hypothetical protein
MGDRGGRRLDLGQSAEPEPEIAEAEEKPPKPGSCR